MKSMKAKLMLVGLLVGAASLLTPTAPSHAQMMGWGIFDWCSPGHRYDAKRDVCVPQRKSRRVYRKRRKGKM